MNKSIAVFLVFLSMAFMCVINTQPVKANGIITVMADGSIDPPTANITSVDNVTYALTDDIYGYLRVERNNTVVAGAGYTVTGGGIVLYYVSNVRIEKMKIKASNGYGVTFMSSSNNVIAESNIANNQRGITLDYSSNRNSIIGNNITANNDYGLGVFSNYNNISGNNIADNYRGIYLGSSNNNISGNTITGSNQYGIIIDGDHYNNSISGNTITANGEGITLDGSSNNSISGNDITNNLYGISLLDASSNNNISENIIAEDNGYGIFLSASSDNSIFGNDITNNQYGISSGASSNNGISRNTITANKKCGIHLVGWSSSNNISGNTITANNPDGDIYLGGGIEISGPSNNISRNTITANKGYGLRLSGPSASNNSVSGNTVTENNESGIVLYASSYNRIFENSITANKKYGIFPSGSSSYNSMFGNSIINNEFGVFFSVSSNNEFYHNTLVNNAQPEYTDNSVNVWDDGYPSGGNFWSDYAGTDSNGDGIGDTPYVIDENNQDRYPLVAPAVWDYSTPIPIVSNGTVNWVSLSSNSTISTLEFNQTQIQISFNVTGAPGTTGYCNISCPKQLMWAEKDQWRVLVGGVAVTPTVTEDADNTYLYFTYSHSTKIVEIRGTDGGESPQQSELFPTTWIIAVIAIMAIAVLTGYLFLKRKK
jgi:parallel beta-helix repeat protein